MEYPIPDNIQPAFPVSVPRKDIPAKFRELIGLDQIPQEADFSVMKATQEEELTVTRVRFSNYLGETISATLMWPSAATDPLAGVVCMNGTASNANHVAHPRFHRPKPDSGPLYGWGRELARRGYAILTFTPKGAERRRKTLRRWEQEARLLIPFGRSQISVLADEVLRVSLILGTFDQVDAGRIGLTGMSLGGWGAWLGMATGSWIRTAALVCGGLGSLHTNIYKGRVERHSSFPYIPHMLRYFDHANLVAAALAPRPLMMVAPTEDQDMPKEGVDELIRVVTPVYEAAGHPERFKVYQVPGKHLFKFEYFDWVVEWFDRFLAPDV